MNSGRLYITPRSLCFEKTSVIAETITSSLSSLWANWTAPTTSSAPSTPRTDHPNGYTKAAVSITARGAATTNATAPPDTSFVIPFTKVCAISLDGPHQAVSPFRVATENMEYIFSMMDAREEAYDLSEALWGIVLDEQTKREEEILRSVACVSCTESFIVHDTV